MTNKLISTQNRLHLISPNHPWSVPSVAKFTNQVRVTEPIFVDMKANKVVGTVAQSARKISYNDPACEHTRGFTRVKSPTIVPCATNDLATFPHTPNTVGHIRAKSHTRARFVVGASHSQATCTVT